jgi:CRP-like cAMP-binding protein
MGEDKSVRKLRLQLETALVKQKDDLAIELLVELCRLDPKGARWPHKLGDLYRKHRRRNEAIEAYATAADLYFDQGFLARAVAMGKTVIDLDPRRTEVLERIDPSELRRLHAPQRPPTISFRPPAPEAPPQRRTQDAGPKPSDGFVSPRRHHAVIAEDESLPPRHHAVIPEGGLPRARHPAVIPEDEPPGALAEPRRQSAQGDVAVTVPPPPPTRREPSPGVSAPKAAGPSGLGRGSAPDLSIGVIDVAPELTRAPDAEPSEVRFSDAPPAMAVTVGLTEQELAPRARAQPSSLRGAPAAPDKLAALPLFPLFGDIPQPALVSMITDAELIELGDGELVVRKGEPADALYGIVEGSVRIIVASHVPDVTLAEGDVFGESCLLAREKCHADIAVGGRLTALRIPRQVLAKLVGAHPRLTEVLLELLTRRLLTSLLLSSPLFQEFDAGGQQAVIAKFEVRRAARGTVLADIGKMSDGLYVSLTGTLEVSFADGRPGERHEAGTLFGQASLLSRSPSDIRVRTLTNMLVLRLPTQAFQTIAMQHAGMLAHLSTLADSSVAHLTT